MVERKLETGPTFLQEATLKTYREEAIKAAKGLGYGAKTVKLIEKAESENEITRIMKDARKRKFGLED